MSHVVESIFFGQLPTPFHHRYFRWEKRAPLRSCETWPCLNSCSRSVQSKGTPTGAYLAHPSIKVEAKAGKQVYDSFSLKLVTLTYLLILSSSSGTPPRHPIFHISSNGRSGNEAPNGRVTEGCPCSSLLFVRCYDGIGRAARRRRHQRADPCFRLSPTMTTGGG